MDGHRQFNCLFNYFLLLSLKRQVRGVGVGGWDGDYGMVEGAGDNHVREL